MVDNSTQTNLATILSSIKSLKNGLSCEPIRNASSTLLKHVNIIILDSAAVSSSGSKSLASTTTTAATTVLGNATNETAGSNSPIRSDYDYNEAVLYIVFILFWYSSAVLMLMKMQSKNADLYFSYNSYSSDEKDVHNVLKSIRERNVKRQALGKSIVTFEFKHCKIFHSCLFSHHQRT